MLYINRRLHRYAVSFAVMALFGCEKPKTPSVEATPVVGVAESSTLAAQSSRWYTEEQVSAGEILYTTNCLVCHGVKGVGDPNWRRRNADGSMPPPALNGTAHTWHHNKPYLVNKIMHGAQGANERMPSFQNSLSQTDVESIIAYFQSFWDDEIYEIWWSNEE